jgi:hypothetical protein
MKCGVLQGSILDTLSFAVYINDLPKAMEPKAIRILFADGTGTSILIASPNNNQFQSDLNVIFGQLNKWFKSNLPSFQFTNKSTCPSDIQITYEDKQIHTAITLSTSGSVYSGKAVGQYGSSSFHCLLCGAGLCN